MMQPAMESLESRRHFSTGSIDTSFASSGKYVFPGPISGASTFNLTGGRTLLVSSDDKGVDIQRLLPGGKRDPTYPAVALNAGLFNPEDNFVTAAVTPNGGLIVVDTHDQKLRIRRVTPAGTLDPTFGVNGSASIELLYLETLAPLADGRTVIAGVLKSYVNDNGGNNNLRGICVLTKTGKIDTTFAPTGIKSLYTTVGYVDQYLSESQSVSGEQMFALPKGKLLNLHDIRTDATEYDDSDNVLGNSHRADIIAKVYNPDGSTDTSFVFDRTKILGNKIKAGWLAGSTTQNKDRSYTFDYFLDDTPLNHNDVSTYTVYSSILAPDGTLKKVKAVARHIPFLPDLVLRDHQTGDTFAQEAPTTAFLHYRANGRRDATFKQDEAIGTGSLKYYYLRDASFAESGDLFASYTQDPNGYLTRLQTSEAPSATFSGPAIRQNTRAAYRFAVTFHDDDKVKLSSITSASVAVVFPDGSRHSVLLVSTNRTSDDKTITATYRLINNRWNSADNGIYQIAVQANQVSDLLSNTSAARAIGRFLVHIPNPALKPLATMPNAMIQRAKEEAARERTASSEILS
jgi:hypothetical protein